MNLIHRHHCRSRLWQRHLAGLLPWATDGDATALPFPDGTFDVVVCFTMLHHLPAAELQDRLFTEARRVLRPSGTFAGSDSRGNRCSRAPR